jgi:hypothetical protein
VSDADNPAKLPKLSINRPGQKLEEFQLVKSPVLVGRVKSNDIVILGDSAISREHCRFDLDTASGKLTLRDLGSSNGTFLNGSAVGLEPIEVKSGDKIQLGATIMTYNVDRPSLGAVVKLVQQKFKNAPMAPVNGEAERVVFKESFCTCGRCGSTFSIRGQGPGEKVGCSRCRAVWRIPVVKPEPINPQNAAE